MDNEHEQSTQSVVASGGRKKRDALFVTIQADQFPASFPQENDVEVGLVSLTADEEIQALRDSAGVDQGATLAMTKASLRMFGGRKIERENLEHEELWEKVGGKVRNLLVAAFMQLWAADRKAVETMKASFRVGSIEC